MQQICVIRCNGKDKAYFDNEDLAKQAFNIIKKTIKSRIVNTVIDNDFCFSFYFGWEEITVSYTINSIDTISNIEDFKF